MENLKLQSKQDLLNVLEIVYVKNVVYEIEEALTFIKLFRDEKYQYNIHGWLNTFFDKAEELKTIVREK